jgi:hypothetical protein
MICLKQRENRVMANFRTLFLAVLLVLSTHALSAQTTREVRATPAFGQYATVAEAVIDADDGDIIDIEAGTFAGATINKNVTIQGANVGVPLAGWGDATNITSAFTMDGANRTVTIEGVRFGNAVVPVNGASNGAVVTLTNCKFVESAAINTTGLAWAELVVSNSSFDGADADEAGAAATNAIVAAGLTTTVDVRENTFNDYTGTALSLTGANGTILVKYNEFTNNNTAAASSSSIDAALTMEGGSITGSAEIQNNLFTSNKSCFVISGTITGKNISFQYNKFLTTTYFAIKNTGTGTLSASCNAYGDGSVTPVAGSTVRGLVTGSVEAGPFNSIGADIDGDAVGFEPNADQKCATAGPVKSSTTEGSNKSYFRIQDAIDATTGGAGAEVKVSKDTYDENLTINKTLKISTWTTGWVVDTANGTSKSDANWAVLNGTITVTSAASTAEINGLKITSSTATSGLITTNASTKTSIRNCWILIDPSTNITTTPTNGAIHQVRAGALEIGQCKIHRPQDETQQYIRALTFASGNGARTIEIWNNVIQGTVQLSGLSSLSSVRIKDNTISNGAIDGISVTGNSVRTLTVTGNTISTPQQHGIAFRNSAAIGANSASITGNKITGSPSGYASVFIASGVTGAYSYTDNYLADSAAAHAVVKNDRSGYTPTFTCNWWGTVSEDRIVNDLISGAGTVTYDDSPVVDDYDGWRSSNGNANSETTGYAPEDDGNCTVRAFAIVLSKTDVLCPGASTGSATATFDGTIEEDPNAFDPPALNTTYSWTRSEPGYASESTKDISSIAVGTYTLTVTSHTGNTRAQSITLVTTGDVPTIATITAPAAVCDGGILSLSTPTVTPNGSSISSEGWKI